MQRLFGALNRYSAVVATLAVLSIIGILFYTSYTRDTYFQGYVEGEYVHIASPFAGRLDGLFVHRGQNIDSGTPLFVLEHCNETAAFDQAKAQLNDLLTGKRDVEMDVLKAQLTQAIEAEKLSTIQLERDEEQYIIGAISRNALDNSRTTNKKDKARADELQGQVATGALPARIEQINSAKAALAQKKWQLDQKQINAPVNGLVFDTMYVKGEWVNSGAPIVSMLPPENIKILFFVPEAIVGKLAINNELTIRCDGCAQDIQAHITYISPQAEFTPPIIYSNETRNKLTFMIEARPTNIDKINLHPGQPVEVFYGKF